MTEQEKREKVIKALECCTKKVCIYKDTEKECPYWELCGEYEDSFEDCTTAMSKDALALLKAQEPVEPKMMEFVDKGLTWEKYGVPTCGVCGALLGDALFCPMCGRGVKWE